MVLPYRAAQLRATMSPSSAPAMAPDHDQDGIMILSDRHYALHGEIMMMVLIFLFVAFVFSMAMITRVRRARTSDDDSSVVSRKRCCCFQSLCNLVRKKKKKRKEEEEDDDDDPPRESNDVTRKSPP